VLYIGLADANEIAKVRRVMIQRGLSSHVDDNKWRELCTAVAEELPFPPPYQVKLVASELGEPEELESAPSYYGDWARTPEASMGSFIEWIKVAPKVRVPVGHRSGSKVLDCSKEFRDLLERLRVPFTEGDGFFTIFGHTANPAVFG
jgi:hypothetical protein